MNFKKIGLSAAIAAATIAAGLATTAPAEAALIKGSTVTLKNNIQGGALKIDPTNTGGIKFDFFGARNAQAQPIAANQGVTVVSGTGDFLATNSNPIARIKDLNLASTLNPNLFKLGALSNFLTGLDAKPSITNLNFDLASFVYNKSTGIGRFKGTFTGGQVGLGTFTLGSAILKPVGSPAVLNDFNYSLSLTAVPTPALLPGLLGLGAAALRKRKGEAAEAETAEVKA